MSKRSGRKDRQPLKYVDQSGQARDLLRPSGLETSEEFIQYYLNLLTNTKYFFRPVSNPFIATVKQKCVEMDGDPDYIVLYDYETRDSNRIYDHVIPKSVYKNNPISYFTFLIDTKGLRFGHVKDALELGVPHMMLIKDERDPVYIGGEILIEDSMLYFNFESGTFSRALRLEDFPIADQNYIDIVAEILEHTFPSIDEAFFTDDPLLPTARPAEEDLDEFCEKYPNRIFYDPKVKKCWDDPNYERAVQPENDICKIRAKLKAAIQQKSSRSEVTNSSSASESGKAAEASDSDKSPVNRLKSFLCPWCKRKPSIAPTDDFVSSSLQKKVSQASSSDDDFLAQPSKSNLFADEEEDFLAQPSKSSLFAEEEEDFLSQPSQASDNDDDFLAQPSRSFADDDEGFLTQKRSKWEDSDDEEESSLSKGRKLN